jgi:hypothetical protein
MMFARLPITVTLLLIVAPGLSAQGQVPIEPGARVRYTALGRPGEPAVGTVISVERDTLFLAPTKIGHSYTTVPLQSVTQLEVARVTGSKKTLGTVIGAAAGAIIGGVVGSLTTHVSTTGGRIECPTLELESCYVEQLEKSEPATEDGALVGGLAGGIIGWLIGSSIRTVQWEPVAIGDMSLAISAEFRTRITISARVGH